MSTRSARRPQSVPPLSTLESLLLAQATWEIGAGDWPKVAKLLSKHPLLSRPKSFFTTQSSQAMYENLMKEAGLELSEANHSKQSPTNRKLAEKHYRVRFEELRALITAEETKFRTVLKEIEEIRAGLWDKKIQAKVTGESLPEQDSEDLGGIVESTDNAEEAQVEEGVENPEEASPAERSESDDDAEVPSAAVGEVALENESSTHAPEVREDIDMKEVEEESSELAVEDRERVDQREEEEEEEAQVEEESKEEEEETSQGQGEPLEEENIEEDNADSPKSAGHSIETGSEPGAGVSEAGGVIDEGQSSEVEEPVVPARRSSRRRKSSAAVLPPPLPTRTRLRARTRASESEHQAADSDNEEHKESTPAGEDERTSSPFDSGRRRDGKRKASFVESADSPHDKKRLREDSEPVDEDEPGPSSHNTRARSTRNAIRTDEQVALKRFQNVIGMLHSQISQHRNGTIFHNPIKPSEAPDYHDIVKRPMDLKTIKTRTKDGVIGNSLEYTRDIYLMFANAMMYNRPGSDVYAMAEDMMLESENQIVRHRETEGLVKKNQRA